MTGPRPISTNQTAPPKSEFRLQRWEDYEPTIKLLRDSGSGGTTDLLFRGQANASWRLETTLQRATEGATLTVQEYYHLIRRMRPVVDTFSGSSWEMPDFGELDKLTKDYDPFSRKLTIGDLPARPYLAYLRHYGFPSPLLDWTRSPYIAAFFAFQRKPEGAGGDVAVYVFDETPNNMKGRSSGEPSIYSLRGNVETDKRHFNQQSQYTVSVQLAPDRGWVWTEHEATFRADQDWGTGQDQLAKIIMPASERPKVLKALDQFNLNAFSLFGSQESLLEMLAVREIDLAPARPRKLVG